MSSGFMPFGFVPIRPARSVRNVELGSFRPIASLVPVD
jgi:hypothetical protein